LGDDATIKTMMVTRRVLRQKEVTLSMATGRYGKNELILHLTGLDPDYDITQAVTEASRGIGMMEEKNPINLPLSPKAKALVDKGLAKGAKDAEADQE
jgi:hypothetical protein